MTIISRLVKFSRRQLHTIVSKDFIKPSSPTPSNLKTYNLSLLDQTSTNTFMPMVALFPNSHVCRDKTLDLKSSLSRTLTKYYPFAGRLDKLAPAFIDCNDDGAEFLEASVDGTLSDFLQRSQHEDLDEFFPYGQVHRNSNRGDDDPQSDRMIPLAVQVNHFECGGIAVAVSLSHKIADGVSMAHFFNDWAKIARLSSRDQKHKLDIDPKFISFPDININCMGFSLERSSEHLTWSFMFPNSKINELKVKVKAMTAESGQPIANLTRVEVLNWLLHKCAVAAATKNNLGVFKPTLVAHPTNIRGKMIQPLPEKSIGNFYTILEIFTNNESEMRPEAFINELQKKKTQLKGLKDIDTFIDLLINSSLEQAQRNIDRAYICTSLCGLPLYDIDFGWGKPVKTTIGGNLRKNSFILIDAPNGDGIEALVCLGKEDMKIIQSDPELLAFC
ncbi:transferase, Chloramphenicol acetyltransferase-like domain protein [Artemisia annua]|uniref:Transferase, Chloramphenicol acetyltransferase-like domain protein n=1 Tax=Artemisia annua TaxID=35608 RepID=A0A2U1MRY4_ARTAN|nr:transferase, Chloramphenicol acetyltransferase-like domain protein [Artemisia annua]